MDKLFGLRFAEVAPHSPRQRRVAPEIVVWTDFAVLAVDFTGRPKPWHPQVCACMGVDLSSVWGANSRTDRQQGGTGVLARARARCTAPHTHNLSVTSSHPALSPSQWLRRADPVDKVYYLPMFIEWWEQWFSYSRILPASSMHTWSIRLPETHNGVVWRPGPPRPYSDRKLKPMESV